MQAPNRSARADQPLIAIPLDTDRGDDAVYFTSDEEADAFVRRNYPDSDGVHPGIWHDIDADDMLDALDRIRHATAPTPPIDEL